MKDVFLRNYGQFEVKKLLGVEFQNGEYCAEVWWRGFEKAESTFVPVEQLMEDIPDMMMQHIIDNKEKNEIYTGLYNRHVAEAPWIQVAGKKWKHPAVGALNRVTLNSSGPWSTGEHVALRVAICAYGIGNWEKIVEAGDILPNRSADEIHAKAIEMLGDANIPDYHGLRVDPIQILEHNRVRMNVVRIGGVIAPRHKEDEIKDERIFRRNRLRFESLEREVDPKKVKELVEREMKRPTRSYSLWVLRLAEGEDGMNYLDAMDPGEITGSEIESEDSTTTTKVVPDDDGEVRPENRKAPVSNESPEPENRDKGETEKKDKGANAQKKGEVPTTREREENKIK